MASESCAESFKTFFQRATGNPAPLPYQSRLALDEPFPSLLDVPTGLGKTAAAILAWIWRRRFAGPSIRATTPRRLIYCLPMRVLVEQTYRVVLDWLKQLGLFTDQANERHPEWSRPIEDLGQHPIAVHLLLGGGEKTDWALWPERDAILIGTQDMLLSRAMNRGYAAGRARWPQEFGLLIDHVMVWASGGFEQREVDALRRLTRLRQRGGRPDLLVSPIHVGQASEYPPWREADDSRVATFVSATPYFSPLHLSHGKAGSGRTRSITRILREGLHRQGISEAIEEISEIVFDYAPEELGLIREALTMGAARAPISPRQGWWPADGSVPAPPLARPHDFAIPQFRAACLKDPDEGFPFGLSVGLMVDNGSRFVRAMSFGRRRRHWLARGHGRMLRIQFERPRIARPFAVGDQCHFGLGLFLPVLEERQSP